ncbi:MAG: PHP domain-containing protein [Bacteroidales bacterium]|nr:PHP domain-containing protein [Bacteroidales bacterium]
MENYFKPFSHLHVHTVYSPDSTAIIDDLFHVADVLGMPGLAMTDHGTVNGAREFLEVSKRYPKVKPILGCEAYVTEQARHLILLAKNAEAFANLMYMLSVAECDKHNRPCISHELLVERHDGLICLSACIGGEIPQLILHDDMEGAMELAGWYKELFGDDFYLEVSLHKNMGPIELDTADNREAYFARNHKLVWLQKKANAGIFEIGEKLGIKVVATNDVHFVRRSEGVSHDAMLSLLYDKQLSDPKRIRYSHLEYLKFESEMAALFPGHPEVLENTYEIVQKVEPKSSPNTDWWLPGITI